MSDESKNVEIGLPQARGEPDISMPGFHKLRLRVSFLGETKDTSGTLRVWFSKHLLGMGRVEVDEINVRYCAKAAGKTFSVGIVNAASNVTAATIGMIRGNFTAVSNAYNAGVMHEHSLSVPGNLSKQIQPVSSLLPDFKVCISQDAEVSSLIEFVLLVYGETIVTMTGSELGN